MLDFRFVIGALIGSVAILAIGIPLLGAGDSTVTSIDGTKRLAKTWIAPLSLHGNEVSAAKAEPAHTPAATREPIVHADVSIPVADPLIGSAAAAQSPVPPEEIAARPQDASAYLITGLVAAQEPVLPQESAAQPQDASVYLITGLVAAREPVQSQESAAQPQDASAYLVTGSVAAQEPVTNHAAPLDQIASVPETLAAFPQLDVTIDEITGAIESADLNLSEAEGEPQPKSRSVPVETRRYVSEEHLNPILLFLAKLAGAIGPGRTY